ncbi:MAG: hypothetical protein H7329_01870 [Opitutaceae bacterium]|nr:hypothetical protein [Cytophagales bacterium]
MKRIIFVLLFYALIFQIKAQAVFRSEDVFRVESLTWYGLNFTLAQLVGPFDNIKYSTDKDAAKLRDHYFRAWNDIVIQENPKYNVAKFYKKKFVDYDLSEVERLNALINPEKILINGIAPRLTLEKIQSAIHNYDTKGKSGIGLVYVVETFNKLLKKSIIHVTFFDMSTKNIIFLKTMEANPSGGGLRNYWAKCIHITMTGSSERWARWKKEVTPKRKK